VRRLLIFALTGALVLGLAAAAQAVFKQTYDLRYTTKRVKSSTGFDTKIAASESEDPNGKPKKAARKVVIKFAAGTKFDTLVPRQCRATNEQIQGSNGGVCPTGSKVGAGSAEAVTGFGGSIDPVGETIVAYNNRNQLIMLLRPKSAVGQTAVLRGSLRNSRTGPTITVNVPPFCLPGGTPPDCKNGEAVLTKFNLLVKGISKTISGKRRNYATTPSTCPRAKNWKTTATFTYSDGSRQTVRDTSPCSRP
jgi:hypothetical protein